MLNIEGLSSNIVPLDLKGNEKVEKSSGDFGKVFDIVSEANQNQHQANKMMSDVLLGKSEDTHGALIALEKVSIQMELMVKVRDELIQGYNKLMNIQI